MALAPLRSGPHTVRADRLAFATPVPVREAAGGHWITLGHRGDDEEGGGVHVYIGGGSGPGSGTIIKGPKGLLGAHIAALASHPSVSKAQHHPVGHEPPGARDHPHYAEREAQSALAKGEEAAKRPGKPYARLHGAEQGTRHEQIGKALSEAQEAARATPGDAGEPEHDVQWHKNRLNFAAHAHQEAITELAWHRARHDPTFAQHGRPSKSPPVGDAKDREMAARLERAKAHHHDAIDALNGAEQRAQATGPEHKVADTAVAHQQAQAELAAHRAAHDRNPNPWAPHLSPPVGDAKDKELAEKATRAQLAHQAAQAQQQGAQQQQQTERQRAHEKEMVRLKQAGAQRREAGAEAPARPRAADEHARSDPQAVAAYMRGIDDVPDADLHSVASKIELGEHLGGHNQATRSAIAQQIRAHAGRPKAERDAQTAERLGLGKGPITPLGPQEPSTNVARTVDPRATGRAAARQRLARTPEGRQQLRSLAQRVEDDTLHGLPARTVMQAIDAADKAHGTARARSAVDQLERRLSENTSALDAAERRAPLPQGKSKTRESADPATRLWAPIAAR